MKCPVGPKCIKIVHVRATCDSGEILTGGGWTTSGGRPGMVVIYDSHPDLRVGQTWTVDAGVRTGEGFPGVVQAIAMCVKLTS